MSPTGEPVRRFIDPAYVPQAATPGDLRQRIDTLDVKEKLDSYFMEPIGGSPQDPANFMQTELRVMTPVIKRTGVKVD